MSVLSKLKEILDDMLLILMFGGAKLGFAFFVFFALLFYIYERFSTTAFGACYQWIDKGFTELVRAKRSYNTFSSDLL